jgi:hypothetical protein
MLRWKHPYRKPDPLLVLTLLVSLAVMVTSAVNAADAIDYTLDFSNLKDGEVQIVPPGHHGATMHMSYQTNPYMYEPPAIRRLDTQLPASSPTFYLSLRVPW